MNKIRSLILMYVFYDANGDIKAITPALDEHFSSMYSFVTLPLPEVEMFLTSQKNTFDYYIKEIQKVDGSTHKLTKKNLTINYTRTLDNYLSKIEDVDTFKGNTLIVTNDTINKNIIVELNKSFRAAFTDSNISEEYQVLVEEFISKGPSTLYLTKRNNPYHLLFSCTFNPRGLINTDRLYFKYVGNYNNTSVYTKKLVSGYGYKEKVE